MYNEKYIKNLLKERETLEREKRKFEKYYHSGKFKHDPNFEEALYRQIKRIEEQIEFINRIIKEEVFS